MAYKKSPLQVINLAQMPLDVVKKKTAVKLYEGEEVSNLAGRLVCPTSTRMVEPPQDLGRICELEEVVPRRARMEADSEEAPPMAASDTAGGRGGFVGIVTCAAKCTLLAALIKWTYDVGVWSDSRTTLALSQAFGGSVNRICEDTKKGWRHYYSVFEESSLTEDEEAVEGESSEIIEAEGTEGAIDRTTLWSLPGDDDSCPPEEIPLADHS